MRLIRLAVSLSWCCCCALPLLAQAADCQALLARHMASDLGLPFDAFDQNDQQGWRPLADASCEAEAAELIAAYAAQHPPHPVLTWHRAQMLAHSGQTQAAIAAARETLRPPNADEASGGFDWNDYALATIAFLQGDKAALQTHRDQLAEAAQTMAFNKPNLAAVDRLLRCFGQPYKTAYSCPAAP